MKRAIIAAIALMTTATLVAVVLFRLDVPATSTVPRNVSAPMDQKTETEPEPQAPLPESPKTPPQATQPLDDALSRVTKKGFGLFVRPGESPVIPERFKGFHSGVDFETTDAEKDADVAVRTICDGPLRMKKWASGYGGVAVQSCTIEGQDVMVVYGHVRLASVSAGLNQELRQGEVLGLLGKAFSTETDGERKHLHLGIHKGTSIDIKGYVQTRADLEKWIDIRTFLPTE